MARGSVIVLVLALALVAVASGADAKGEKKPKDADREDAGEKARDRRERDDPAPPPAEPPPPAAIPPPAAAPAITAPIVEPAPQPVVGQVWGAIALWTPEMEAHRPGMGPATPEDAPPKTETPLDTASTSDARSRYTPPTPAKTDALGAQLATQGATARGSTTRAPAWSAAPAPAREAPAGAWWAHLLWTISLATLGGAAAVLVHKRRDALPTSDLVSIARPRTPMTPVAPSDLAGILRNAQAAASRGALAEAIAWFDHALRLAPRLGVAHFCKGVCLAANGRMAEAYGALRSACDATPDDASYRVHLARAAVALGKHKEAMDALETVARAMPELGAAMLDDAQLAGLRDHPRFLMMCGAL